MELIKITDQFVILNSEPYNDATLRQGKTYLLRKDHAQGIAGLGLGQIVEGADRLPHFTRAELRTHRRPLNVLFLFDGGFGDAISLAVLLNALEQNYNIRANIACKHEIWQDILKPLGFSGDWYQLPVEADIINVHDYIQIQADKYFKDKNDKWNLCIVEELGFAYKVDLNHSALNYSIPEKVLKKTALPQKPGIRIGLNFDSKGKVRSYPKDIQPILANLLLQAGFEIFLFGTETPNLSGMDEDNIIHDYCGKTPVPELASMIQQMDLMICMDSFIAHLSNMLGTKTLVLLSTTRKGVFNWHRNISCLESKMECAPCGEVANSCPEGHDQCTAFFHESMTPAIIAFSAINECAKQYNNLIHTALAGNE